MLTHTDLYGVRMLVFLEAEPQSNKYHQFIFNPEQFKKVSEAIATCFNLLSKDDVRIPEGAPDEVYDVQLSAESYPLPDLREIQ